ncbi:ABC transporter transmembrane region [Alkalidesulfovibrio alkalitolerans DSM 16529]|jgi:subfamily B ATP-binding cassette protein MsbA|uniref:ABC transporter transmembrane region n=1 Tax=Alkalidesulfovibrio alkalitolerans DSM 16529 TaxID=1121439 RepID=S7T1M2_9BACT|nr:ABC transporter transmembrane region [Alkalidesulfovibrio alkalitolerans DSM 16529]
MTLAKRMDAQYLRPRRTDAKHSHEGFPLVEEKKPHLQNWYLLKRCLRYFKPYTWRIVLAFACMGVVAAATGAAAYLVKPALDEIFINKQSQALYFLPPLFVLVIAAKGLGRFLQNYIMQSCGLEVLEQIRRELYAKMVRLPLRFFEDNQVGMLMSRIIYDVMSIRNSMPAVVMIVRQALTMLFLIGVVFYQNAFLAFWAVLVLPLAFYPFVYFGKKLRGLSRKNQVKLADISVFLQESFSGIRVVKAFANEDREKGRFEQENGRLIRIFRKEMIYNELSSPIMELVGALGIGLVIFYGGMQVISGESTPGTFFSFCAGLIMLYEPIKKMSESNKEIQRALAGAERVFEILDSPEISVERDGTRVFSGPLQELRFENVTFQYPGCDGPALDKVSFTVRAGETLALVGPSGSGKSTLVHLIPRFYLPSGGTIMLNGHALDEFTLDSLRLNIGMVSQDTFLFNTSVAENIAYGREALDMDKVQEAAKAAYAHEFILQLQQGYETIIGERGVKLSGGQKQRLTIARALLKNPPLLILDEATSALDTESERIVQKALENLMRNRTSIVIAHRLSTVLGADRILVMEKGRVIAEGRHDELLASCPLYRRLYSMQFMDMTEDGPRTCDQAVQAALG